MTQTPELTTNRLFELGMGFMSAKMLLVATQLDLFAALGNEPKDLETLAAAMDVPDRTLRMVADAMVALEILENESGKYRNGPVAATFLTGDGPVDARPMLKFWDAISYHAWTDLENLVRTDSPPVLHDLDEARQKIFSEGIEAATAGSAGAIAAAYDFAPHQRLLDIGGGTGSILQTIMAANSHLRGTLVDAPAVTEIAKAKLSASPVHERVSVVGADILNDDLPTGHDVVLLSHVVHYFRAEGNIKLLSQIRKAVEPGTRLLASDFWTNDTHSEPLVAVLMAGQFLTSMGGDVFSEAEMITWLGKAGWKYVETTPLPGFPEAIVVAEAA